MNPKQIVEQAMETTVKAPKVLKQKTFQKIEEISLLRELFSFYSSIPILCLHGAQDGDNETNQL